jgi:putative phosphoesterase
MKICVMSDSHGERDRIKAVITRHDDCEMYLHAGDHADDVKGLREFVTVSGNCDLPTDAPAEQLLELEGINLMMTHGHHYHVKQSMLPLSYRAAELSADLVVFGHSHVPTLAEESGIVYLNPGSLSFPRGGFAAGSYALLQLQKGVVGTKVSVEFFTCNGEPMPGFELEKVYHTP